MLFNTFNFLFVFLPIVLGVYFCLGHKNQNRFLVLASCVFYASWDWRFLLPLLFTTSLDYYLAQKMEQSILRNEPKEARKHLLLISVVFNLGLLSFFKYFNFFVGSAVEGLAFIGVQAHVPTLEIVLPVAISFYTFQALSYTIDVYRGEIHAGDSFWDFFLAVLYFPHLVAGPIQRAANLIPQVTNPRTITMPKVLDGVHLIFWGMFKKVFIADNLAVYVDLYFGKVNPTGWETTLGVLAFTFQIYCDFSGYTDIARGIAKVMGFEFVDNFKLPYFATNPSDFWRRWHISLSTWLRDYLYKPLGGNQQGTFRTYINLTLTMLLGGLWHGAAWNFVIWGAYHGALLVVHKLLEPFLVKLQTALRFENLFAWKALKIAIMFVFTCYGWLLFRASSFDQISKMTLSLMSPFAEMNMDHLSKILWLIAPLVVVQVIQYSKNELIIFRWIGIPTVAKVVFYAACLYGMLFLGGTSQSFVYFQF
jgi:alginate O-acetyltransferase complex protein AlgI